VYSVQSHRHTGIVIGRDSCDSRAKCQRYIFLVSLDTVPSLADEIAQLLVGGAEPRRHTAASSLQPRTGVMQNCPQDTCWRKGGGGGSGDVCRDDSPKLVASSSRDTAGYLAAAMWLLYPTAVQVICPTAPAGIGSSTLGSGSYRSLVPRSMGTPIIKMRS
jgi:hypothetical protein